MQTRWESLKSRATTHGAAITARSSYSRACFKKRKNSASLSWLTAQTLMISTTTGPAEASAELGIGHPLAEAGFGKREIRILAKHLGLANWNAPAAACLASRIPCDTALDEKSLALVSSAEDFLCGLGFPECRVRKLGTLAKIEVGTHHLAILWEKRETVNERLRTLGFKSVAIDLAGYQQGAMNNLICKPSGLDS